MNRYKEENVYVFRPPKYSRFWAPIIYFLSDFYYLHRKHRVIGVKVLSGGEEVIQKYRNGDSLLITPNHSDHCDPHTLLHLSRRFKIPVHFMAAREIFEKKKGLHGSVLQRAGVFSIDREGSDLKSIKEAMRIMGEARFPLVMFPEGEIYHLNERLTHLNEGAATLALRSAKRIKKEKSQKGAYIVPTAMKYSYVDDISSTFPRRLAKLESHILWAPQTHLSVVERVYKFGEAALSLKEKEYLDRTLEGSLDGRLVSFRKILIEEEEQRYFSAVGEGNHAARVRKLRGKIRTILLDSEKPTQKVIEQCYRSLDRLYLAIQLYSYPGQYLKERPSMDRIAETIHKFEEDVLETNRVVGKRNIEVTFCKPINLMDYLDDLEADSKKTVTEVTALIEDAIRSVLEK
jgi:1-acyl-sn-glycerol-3-phosphate acyltransferase